jgi:adenylate kinase family enzyme
MLPTRIHILGASGSGTTTLGSALAARLCSPHFDTDDYYWLPTDPPYEAKREMTERQELLRDLKGHESWVLSGSLCGWGDIAIPLFDLVVYLGLPHESRMGRLAGREMKRYGDRILPGGDLHDNYTEFMAWASRYDTAGVEQRSRLLHEEWLASLRCRVLRIEGDIPTEAQVRLVESELHGKSR